MIRAFNGMNPHIAENAFIAETADLIGDVRVGQFASIWYHTVLRADLNSIIIGDYTNIQDGTVIHLEKDEPVIVGNYVTVGHSVILHGCLVEEDCLIGMHATILTGARIGKGSIIAAGALVPENKIIPPYSLVMGIPGKIVRSVTEQDPSGHQSALKYVDYSRQFLRSLL